MKLSGVTCQFPKCTSLQTARYSLKAIKPISQKYAPNSDLMDMAATFTKMANHCIKIGLKEDTHNMKRLSMLCCHELRNYGILSSYKICAISRAAGILSNRKQSVKRGVRIRDPIVKNPFMTNCYGIKHNGALLTIPYKKHNTINILLNDHTQKILSDPALTVRSFSLTALNISLCVSKKVQEIECTKKVGIDRNLRNVTCGSEEGVTVCKTNKLLSIKENTVHARAGFHRNDRRKKNQFWKIKQRRMTDRARQYIHRISKDIVDNAVKEKAAIVLENLKGVRKLYKKGNGQGNKYRRRLNGWQFYELQRQIEYKARWVGLPPVEYVDPRNTSTQCPQCGKRLQEDMQQHRKLSCNNCGLFMDRDIVAAMNNISRKLPPRFRGSRDDICEAQSGTFEPAMTESGTPLAIRIADMSKSSYRG